MERDPFQSLLTPVISRLSAGIIPTESAILQVVAEKVIRHEGRNLEGVKLALSDGQHMFMRFVTRRPPPGKYSLIRIKPSGKNKVIRLWSEMHQEERLYVCLKEWVKILDGQILDYQIGNPVNISNQ